MRESFGRIKKRPIILIFLAVMVLALCVLEQFNSFTKEFGSLKVLTEHSYLGVLSELAQKIKGLAATPGLMAISVLVALLFLLAVSAILGILNAGYAQTFYLAAADQKKKKGDFKSGINRHFLKLTFYIFFAILLSVVFFVLLLYTAVPAVMTIKLLLEGDSGVIFQMLLLCILTVAVIFFAVVFYTMYLSFLLPSLVGFKRGGVVVAFRMVNGYCWYLIPRTLLFLLIMLAWQTALLAMGYGSGSVGMGILVLCLNWIVKLFAFFFYLYFVFSTFLAMKDDMFAEDA